MLLGFTRDGCHLVSYTVHPVAAADGVDGYSLQLWSFHQGQRCRRLWSVPLFRWGLCGGGRVVVVVGGWVGVRVGVVCVCVCPSPTFCRPQPAVGNGCTPAPPLLARHPHRTPTYLEALEDEEEFMGGDDMLLTVAEAPDSSLLGGCRAHTALWARWRGGAAGGNGGTCDARWPACWVGRQEGQRVAVGTAASACVTTSSTSATFVGLR